MNQIIIRRLAATVLAVTALIGLAGCGSDDNADTTTTSTTAAAAPVSSTTTTTNDAAARAETVRYDIAVQQQLADVGCHPGPVDGKLGPSTDAAINAFQTAAGIKVDGELGPQTEAALRKAVADGTKICTATTPTTTTTAANKVTTTTTASNSSAPCTATALLKGLPAEGESLTTYVCSSGYAAGTLNDGTTKFILQSENGQWFAPSQDPCGSASAGLPAVILQDGCSS